MEDVAELPRKAKVRSLYERTNENFDVLKKVENKQYNFLTANKQFQMKWFPKNRNITNVGCQPASSIVEGEIGSLGLAKDVTTPLEAWQLIVRDEFLEKIVTNSNRKISKFKDRFQETLQSTAKYAYCKTTDLTEMIGFFGLLYLKGAINFNTTDVHMNLPTTFSALRCQKSFQGLGTIYSIRRRKFATSKMKR